MIPFIDKVVDAIFESAKEKLGRDERIIRLLKQFGLDDLEALKKFEDVYAYALVEYGFDEVGLCKPELLIEFFKLKEVRDLFQAEFNDNSPRGWLSKGEEIAQFHLDGKLSADWAGFEPRRELSLFAVAFIKTLKATRSTREVLEDQKLDSLQKQIQQMMQQIKALPSQDAINQMVGQLAGVKQPALPAGAEESEAADLARRLGDWFEALDYDRDDSYEEVWAADYFEWMISFQITRRRSSRTLVRGVAGEIGLDDLADFQRVIKETGADEGWLVCDMRVSKAARTAAKDDATYEDISCYTFDELIDEDADFSRYLDWLEQEIQAKGVAEGYLPLACRKDEFDGSGRRKIGVSSYGEEDGWIEGYVDQWLDDPAKEHLSILGEFGTGKTWFALHYAWLVLQRYKTAKQRGTQRPRIPIVVPLRDYAKAVTVESLFSEFFFRKHEILKNYSVFEQLNRMGKLLLIFDGFDEMAARVNRQSMIDNFWQLAKVVVPGAKAILTCRTEHFPDAIEGRRLLGAELKASTDNLTGEPPQFEVLELEKFSDAQIAELLGRKAQAATVEKVTGNEQLLDLARRPVMVDLILEALPEIEADKPVDMARVYLYAVTRKMQRDIRSERTFTSLADKLYFLCELSWEMLSTDRMSLNYRAFPERLKGMFGEVVAEEQELDHWRYDMLGQTMLIRNSEGDYSPAHRSLLEFFVAYKIVASLGAMAEDFTAVAREQGCIDETAEAQDYCWEEYFWRSCGEDGQPTAIPALANFAAVSWEQIWPMLGPSKLAKAVLDLAHPMLSQQMREQLLPRLLATRERSLQEVGYVGGNIAQVILARTDRGLCDMNLSDVKLKGVDFCRTYFHGSIFQGASLADATFSKVIANVTSAVFSPDGKKLVIADDKGTVQLLDIESERVLWIASVHQISVKSVAFSPDGGRIASGSSDKRVKLWSVESGDCLATLEGHQNSVESVAFSPDGERIASGSYDSTVKLWSVESGDCLATLEGHQNYVRSVAFSPDGERIASGSYDSTVKLWSVKSGDCLATLEGHQNYVRSVAFSPDGERIASGSYDSKVKLWSVKSGNCSATLEGHQNYVRSVAFSPDGERIASGSSDKMVKLWSVESGDCLATLEGHQASIDFVAFSPDGERIASGGYGKMVKLWSVESGDCLSTLGGHQNYVGDVAFSPDGERITSGSNDKMVKLWSVESGDCLATLEGHQNYVSSVAFSPDGERIASGSYDSTVKVWSVESGDCLATLEGHQTSIESVAFSPDGERIASGGYDKIVKLWSVESGDCLATLEGHQNYVSSVAFSPDGERVASASSDSTVKLWSVESGACLATLEGHQNYVESVTFSPDGERIASGSSDKMVKLWSVKSGACLNTLEGHQDWLRSVAFSPDGERIASGSDDSTVKLWLVESGDCLATLEGHQDWLRSVAFSPDGKCLVSCSDDETVRIWDVETGECLEVIDERVCAQMNITGVHGLTEGQRTALKLMGAVDHNDRSS